MSDDELERRSNERLSACRTWKDYWVLDFKEAYFFCAPHRQRQISSYTFPPLQRLLDAPELYTDEAFIITQDFVTELVNTYLPEAQTWVERGKGMDIPQEVWDKISDQVKADDKTIFSAIKASNFYAELQKMLHPDIAIGTAGIWIERKHPAKPIECLAVPLRELEVNLGPDGEIDDRFVVRYTRNSLVEGVLGPALWDKVPKDIKDTCGNKPTERTEIRWGFWRLWDEIGDECWQHVVLLGNKLIHDAELRGEGSCPLIVPRFNASADWPWGIGPMLQGLPTFRQIDEMERQRTEHQELMLVPPMGYPDDSFTNVEQGVEPGMFYPVRVGSEKAIVPLYPPTNADPANFQYEEKLKKLRKLFFVDYPEQTGDTPPTLGQWLDEMARAQRRVGGPGMSFWREGPMRIFLRYKYLLEASGAIRPVKVDGRAVAAVPYNPAQRAAEQQEIATAVQASQILGQMFPEEWKLLMDGELTMKAFIEKMRVAGLLKFRAPGKVQQALQRIQELVGARHQPGATPPEGAGPPAAA